MLIDVDVVCCARYELNMMTAAHKTTFEDLFKKKKFYEIPNALYRGWLGFKISAVGRLSRQNLYTTTTVLFNYYCRLKCTQTVQPIMNFVTNRSANEIN